MNNENTIKAIAPIFTSYFLSEVSAEAALDLIAAALKESSTANPATNGREIKKDAPAGYIVTDRGGESVKYQTAISAEIDEDGRLVVFGADCMRIAIYNRLMWTSAEKITA